MAGMVSLARSPEDLKKDPSYGTLMPMETSSERPVYPWGVCFSLDDETLDKLDLDCDCSAGDEIEMKVRFKVTDVGERDTTQGVKRRMELQAVAIKVLGDSDSEPDNDTDDVRTATRYKGSK